MPETTIHMRERFGTAFRDYAASDMRLRAMKDRLPENSGSADIHEISLESRVLAAAEKRYRAARLDYVQRLLSRTGSQRVKS